MDLYLEATGRSIDAKGDVLMIAEDLPKRFVLEQTDDYGMRIVSSDSGVETGVHQADRPCRQPLVSRIERVEVVGENLKGATIHIYTGPGEFPVIIIDDINEGRLGCQCSSLC